MAVGKRKPEPMRAYYVLQAPDGRPVAQVTIERLADRAAQMEITGIHGYRAVAAELFEGDPEEDHEPCAIVMLDKGE